VKYNNVREPVRAMYFRPLLQVAPTDAMSDIRSLYAGAIMLQTKGQVAGLESQVRRKLQASIRILRYRATIPSPDRSEGNSVRRE
jgi:hypothetical protein